MLTIEELLESVAVLYPDMEIILKIIYHKHKREIQKLTDEYNNLKKMHNELRENTIDTDNSTNKPTVKSITHDQVKNLLSITQDIRQIINDSKINILNTTSMKF
ncbi:hypothetical protein QLL95_gp0730 [Cotonvirus japonicus]|uniref:Uncharacterized protein n=1 Tax=Cotonvirus japonicus TaxID=2811091 RepID=A0ABM7NTA9_9VIRU|nr:hypothetical protein QLL95_gp0730 [Cotonvirus japonicus]BCS83393.1 hypothetical protein [Cotonvirus japonicus]